MHASRRIKRSLIFRGSGGSTPEIITKVFFSYWFPYTYCNLWLKPRLMWYHGWIFSPAGGYISPHLSKPTVIIHVIVINVLCVRDGNVSNWYGFHFCHIIQWLISKPHIHNLLWFQKKNFLVMASPTWPIMQIYLHVMMSIKLNSTNIYLFYLLLLLSVSTRAWLTLQTTAICCALRHSIMSWRWQQFKTLSAAGL